MANLEIYKQYDTGYFSVQDTIGVPHSYCIGPKHIEYSDGILDIEKAERHDAHCMVKGCQLSYTEHETALAINCKSKDEDLLHAYLLTIKDQCEIDKYVGFVFIDCTQ